LEKRAPELKSDFKSEADERLKKLFEDTRILVPIKCEVLRKLSFYLNFDTDSKVGHLQIKDFFHN
jgi:hypothetical protein